MSESQTESKYLPPDQVLEMGEMSLRDREMKGIWEAIQYTNKIAKGKRPINQDVIRNIHAKVMKYFRPEVAGKYRDFDVAIHRASIMPVHWTEVKTEMFFFEKELSHKYTVVGHGWDNTEAVLGLAAWAHYELVRIHPFADGNGRTARLLTDLILKRFGHFPITDWGGKSDEYIETLRGCDSQMDTDPLKRFLARKELAVHEKVIQGVVKSVGEQAGQSGEFRNIWDRKRLIGKIANGN